MHGPGTARCPDFLQCAAALASLRSAVAHRAPARAKQLAVALPIAPPPVITTGFVLKSAITVRFLSCAFYALRQGKRRFHPPIFHRALPGNRLLVRPHQLFPFLLWDWRHPPVPYIKLKPSLVSMIMRAGFPCGRFPLRDAAVADIYRISGHTFYGTLRS